MDFETAFRNALAADPMAYRQAKHVFDILDSEQNFAKTVRINRIRRHVMAYLDTPTQTGIPFNWEHVRWQKCIREVVAMLNVLVPWITADEVK